MAKCGPASKAGFAGDIENEDLDAPNCVEAVTEAHISFAEEIGQDEVFEPRGWYNNLRTWKGGKCEKRNLKTQPDPSDDISEFSNSQSSSSWRGERESPRMSRTRMGSDASQMGQGINQDMRSRAKEYHGSV